MGCVDVMVCECLVLWLYSVYVFECDVCFDCILVKVVDMVPLFSFLQDSL